ncbi:MAG: transporter [Rhizobiales bacterium]|nr:transporter [Hyphomicrobiales bacterium]
MVLWPSQAAADGARDWVNVPIDVNLLFAYYTHVKSDTSISSNLPITGLVVDADIAVLRYARTFDLFGKVGAVQVVVPYAWGRASLQGVPFGRSQDGVGDITSIFVANIFGGPALTAKQFAQWQPEPYLTASFWVTAPTGRYNPRSPLNIGTNRWAFKPQLSYGYWSGPGLLAVNAYVQFFTDNDEHLVTRTLKQDPLWHLEAHYSYSFTPKFWAAASLFYDHGAGTTIHGVDQNNWQSTLSLGASASYSFTPATSLSLSYSAAVAKRDITPAKQTIQLTLQQLF